MCMNKKLNNIKVLIWDVDGTFYKHDPAHKKEIRESELRVIMNHTGWSHEKAETEFYKQYLKVSPSGTTIAARLSGVPVAQVAKEGEKYNHVANFVHKDGKLISLFSHLSNYIHYILMNGTKSRVLKIFQIIDIKLNVFREIVTSETVGENKPSLKGFQYILEKTKLPPAQHLMIGDREEVDLVPAKKLGMKTCLVWSDKKSKIADITLKSVYELKNIL